MIFLPLLEVRHCFQPEPVAALVEAGDPEEAVGLSTAQETDCSCYPHHMTHLKPLEAASLRWQGREDRRQHVIHSRASVHVCQATARPSVLLSLQVLSQEIFPPSANMPVNRRLAGVPERS